MTEPTSGTAAPANAERLAGDLAVAHQLADTADAITMARFLAHDLAVQTKPDLTPVSDADTAVERALRDLLAELRPGDAVVGEEYGAHGSGRRRWIIDPIDGTKNFVRGVPMWATLVALQEDDALTVGLVSAPAITRRWWASRGHGAWQSFRGDPPRPLRVSGVAAVADASLSLAALEGWRRHGRYDAVLQLSADCWRSRAYGDFLSHMLVAEGAVDIAPEPEVTLWDLAAIQVIVEEAGGTFTDLAGRPRADGGSAVSTNGLLHAAVLDRLGIDPPG